MSDNYSKLQLDGYMRLNQVLQVIPISKSAWYRGQQEGRYPAAISLGPRTSAYRISEIKQLLDEMAQP